MTVTDAEPAALLARHLPVLRFDAQEPYFADSAAEWTSNPGNVLRRTDGTVLAAATPRSGEPPLSLTTLGSATYYLSDGSPMTAPTLTSDVIADTTARDEAAYVTEARAQHGVPDLADHAYGHAETGSDGRLWLAYWFFYFYNDDNLLGPFSHAGCHEGDWEMIQLRLNPVGTAPDLAVYAQHGYADERPWDEVERVGDQPVVYPARGSHASYFSAGAHRAGRSFDQADGRHPGSALTLHVLTEADSWTRWPGHWGGTVSRAHDLDTVTESSPRGPGQHAQWSDPTELLDRARMRPVDATSDPTAVPPTPQVSALAHGGDLTLRYDTGGGDPVGLIVSTGAPGTPSAVHRLPVSRPRGEVTVAGAAPAPGEAVHVSVAGADGTASPAQTANLGAA